jgi:hypothetical protein
MTRPAVGKKVKVCYMDTFKYTLDVEVTAICPSNEFIGRVEEVHGAKIGPVNPGNEILKLKGREMTFKNEAICTTAH